MKGPRADASQREDAANTSAVQARALLEGLKPWLATCFHTAHFIPVGVRVLSMPDEYTATTLMARV